jgi:hypothetical protein
MKQKEKKYLAIGCGLLLVGCLLCGFIFGGRYIYNKVTSNSLSLTTDNRIDVTPQQVRAMRAIGQWEFLALTDEEMVDTIRQGFFFDDQLVRIYYGTLRLGIDMQQLSDSAFTSRGDTLDVTLPAIQLLDYNFIDEARTRSFISKGNWDASDREALYRRAKAKMLRQCLTPRNIRRARQNAEEQVTDMLRVMGFEKVNLKWKD